MKKVILAFLLFISQLCYAQIGTWHNYLAYYDIQQIQEASDNLFVLASNGLYQYNKNDQSIVTYDKVNGLSDSYITHIRWCPQAKRLLAIYKNMNIDLVETNGNITNISDIYTKAITGDKTLNSIYIYNQYAYLACGFGIVKVNLKDCEITESYIFGIPVTGVTINGNTIYAQTNEGIFSALITDNLIDKANWHISTTTPSFVQENKDYENNISLVKTLIPGGPKYNYFGYMKFYNQNLYTSGGGTTAETINGCIQVLNNNNWTIYQDENIAEQTGVSYQNITCLDYDPTDANHLFAGSRNGLYEFRNSKFVKHYNHTNSPIEAFDNKSSEYELTTGVKFDAEGNLWILNSQAPNQSLIRYANGTFTSFYQSELMKLNDGEFKNKSNGNLSNMIMDSQGYLWFVNNHGWLPALYRYDSHTDELRSFTRFINQDGSSFTIRGDGGVRCVTEDLEGNMWIGTSAGPLMLEKAQITDNDYYFTQVKVPRNDGTDYADYLLAGIDITCIAIDGGGRKWFGTSNQGVYLISADNMTQIQHFTLDNSPLLSNYIQSIAINPSTGEVFFGTELGLCSYISDATQTNTEMNKDNVWAYPNPVNPGYTGPITITGLTYNADIKIVSSNGALVNQGRSNGGTYIWDGNDLQGNRVASGIYMVMTATNTGDKGTVCKVAIIN